MFRFLALTLLVAAAVSASALACKGHQAELAPTQAGVQLAQANDPAVSAKKAKPKAKATARPKSAVKP
jgi:hypothetical protein